MSTEHNISQIEAQMAYMKSQHDLKLAEIKNLKLQINSTTRKTKKINEKRTQIEKKTQNYRMKQNEAIVERERQQLSNEYLNQTVTDLGDQAKDLETKVTELENYCSGSIKKNENKLLDLRKSFNNIPVMVELTKYQVEDERVSKENQKLHKEIEQLQVELEEMNITQKKETKEKIINLLSHAKTQWNLENLPPKIEEYHARMNKAHFQKQEETGNMKDMALASMHSNSYTTSSNTSRVDVKDLNKLFSFKTPQLSTLPRNKNQSIENHNARSKTPENHRKGNQNSTAQRTPRTPIMTQRGTPGANPTPRPHVSKERNVIQKNRSAKPIRSVNLQNGNSKHMPNVNQQNKNGQHLNQQKRNSQNVNQQNRRENQTQNADRQVTVRSTDTVATGIQNTPRTNVESAQRDVPPNTPRPGLQPTCRKLFPTAGKPLQSPGPQKRNSQDLRQHMNIPESEVTHSPITRDQQKYPVINNNHVRQTKSHVGERGAKKTNSQPAETSSYPSPAKKLKLNSSKIPHDNTNETQPIMSQQYAEDAINQEYAQDSLNQREYEQDSQQVYEQDTLDQQEYAENDFNQQYAEDQDPSADQENNYATVENEYMSQQDQDAYSESNSVFSPFSQHGDDNGFEQDQNGAEEERSQYFNHDNEEIPEEVAASVFSDDESNVSLFSEVDANDSMDGSVFLGDDEDGREDENIVGGPGFFNFNF